MSEARVHDHAVIGDGRSAALVDRDGGIDWLCWPRFDSPSLFAGILDAERGGSLRIGPAGPRRARREYLAGTNVLSGAEWRRTGVPGTLAPWSPWNGTPSWRPSSASGSS